MEHFHGRRNEEKSLSFEHTAWIECYPVGNGREKKFARIAKVQILRPKSTVDVRHVGWNIEVDGLK